MVSENGSRFSLPSTARAPFTVTGTSSATGCAPLIPSLPAAFSVARSGFSEPVGSAELSLSVGGMSYSLARESFADLCQDAEPCANLYMFMVMQASQL